MLIRSNRFEFDWQPYGLFLRLGGWERFWRRG
jgi:hypothetical protein